LNPLFKRTKRYHVQALIIAIIFLSACQPLPSLQSQTSSDKPSISVIQANEMVLAEGPRRQMLTMPSLVKTQTMSIPSSGESQALSPLFKLSSAQGISLQPGTHLVTFHSRPTHPQHQIKIGFDGGPSSQNSGR
jgi:hypothetical protein